MTVITFERDSILAALARLSKGDDARRVFGAPFHQYELRPPLDEPTLAAFETEHSVRLPEDYRTFISTIGNGGAGPCHGLFPFGHHDDGFDLQAWSDGPLVGDFSRPFPHEHEWNLDGPFWARRPDPDENASVEEEDRLMAEWDAMLDAHYWTGSVVDGAIPICHLGCARRQWLVINGPQRSYVWNDDRVDEDGLSPLLDSDGQPQTFSAWYLGWLNKALTSV